MTGSHTSGSGGGRDNRKHGRSNRTGDRGGGDWMDGSISLRMDDSCIYMETGSFLCIVVITICTHISIRCTHAHHIYAHAHM